MKEKRVTQFLFFLFPGIVVGILISFLLGLWNEESALLRWEIILLIGFGLAGILTLLQRRTTAPTDEEKKSI